MKLNTYLQFKRCVYRLVSELKIFHCGHMSVCACVHAHAYYVPNLVNSWKYAVQKFTCQKGNKPHPVTNKPCLCKGSGLG